MLKIGMIGMSPGNAHPYSWSSIINGTFDGELISAIGYPAVADYLQANIDTLGIPGASVSHVWSQNLEVSQSIAKNAGIPFVVDKLEDMIGEVDAVILGRDDPENHVGMAKPFLDAGIPLFIDKPLAYSQEDLDYFAQQHHLGKVFMSCSSMRYSQECRTVKTGIKSLGKIHLVTAVGKKDWKKYGVHLLEALFSTLDDPKPVKVQHIGEEDEDIVLVTFENGVKATVHLFKDICGTFQLSFFGEKGWKIADIQNSYSMFRDNLIVFIDALRDEKPYLEFAKTAAIMQVVIGAKESFENGGKVINLEKHGR
ncbi:Gfo/Idh/MocA family protein [Cyclobacterium qasimii]|uniref:Gfo/Idh/MocA-like oxidoreductase N-terminal domain-containing protein n=2 Tax=Cyclobacterium qasimii TaxID=1350429 RepID=A0A512C8V3_9BACT|nr:Gfo/Idh/MocA family oxidoreductase [Cyclobacterium qasimii]EPR68562.1 putative oxidoreductase [Cyclobacterium qasimii M12-11B]GEO20641.1 hypothetical protein CQA01_11750 [Cyclobacterium qasimii]